MTMSTGTSVMAMMADPPKTKVLVNASGRNSFPSCPSSRNTGRKETTMIATAKKMGRPTCFAETMEISMKSSLVNVPLVSCARATFR